MRQTERRHAVSLSYILLKGETMEDKLMTDLALSHYTKDPFEYDDTRTYYQPKDRTYGFAKPRGLWLSVDGELDWPTWCREEDWNTAYLEHKTAFRIKE